jgi:glutathione S-transferase
MITAYVFGQIIKPVIGVTRDLRILWALEETGLPYRLQALNFVRGDLRAPDYVRVSPFACIPAIDDDGFTLFESAAIVLYLTDKAGKLLPADARSRTLATQWAFAAVNTVEPAMIQLFAIDKFSSDPAAEARRPSVVETVQRRLASLDTALSERPFLMGDEFSAPDILMATVLRIVQHTDLLAAVPNVADYKARCEDRPAWKAVIAAYEARLAA